MPVHAVAGGFRWGSSGKIYKTRTAAERQARAIYASGWREDAAKTLVAARLALKASRRAELRYVRDLRGILRGVHRWTMGELERPLADWQPEKRADARPNAHNVVTLLLSGLKAHVARHTSEAFDRMAGEVEKKNSAAQSLLGINRLWRMPLDKIQGHLDLMKRTRDKNIKLVEDAGRDYAAQVREVFDDPENYGLTSNELKERLLERGSVSESRAELIARDQTTKYNAALTRDRHEKAGITRYRWSGSLDERERPAHRELEGKTFDYDDPPVTNDAGETNNPGEDICCRCIAIGIIDVDEDADEDEG